MSDVNNEGSESSYLLSSAISDFGIVFNTIYMSSIKENADVTDPYGILISYN
jgi:hypothetical protein